MDIFYFTGLIFKIRILINPFIWFKVCLSSDKISKLNNKKCALNLRTNSNDENINFEMSSNELDKFISTLELIENVS